MPPNRTAVVGAAAAIGLWLWWTFSAADDTDVGDSSRGENDNNRRRRADTPNNTPVRNNAPQTGQRNEQRRRGAATPAATPRQESGATNTNTNTNTPRQQQHMQEALAARNSPSRRRITCNVSALLADGDAACLGPGIAVMVQQAAELYELIVIFSGCAAPEDETAARCFLEAAGLVVAQSPGQGGCYVVCCGPVESIKHIVRRLKPTLHLDVLPAIVQELKPHLPVLVHMLHTGADEALASATRRGGVYHSDNIVLATSCSISPAKLTLDTLNAALALFAA